MSKLIQKIPGTPSDAAILDRFNNVGSGRGGSIADAIEEELHRKKLEPPKPPPKGASLKEKKAYAIADEEFKTGSLEQFVDKFNKKKKKPKPKKVIELLTEIMGKTLDDNDLLSRI